MLDQIRTGDTIVVWKLERLARSTRDLLETMETIQQAGGKFQSLSEPWADTITRAGRIIMTIFSGIAEFERGLIRERTSASSMMILAGSSRSSKYRASTRWTLAGACPASSALPTATLNNATEKAAKNASRLILFTRIDISQVYPSLFVEFGR